MNYGYFGKILVINLSNGEIKEKEVPDATYKRFLGGYGLGAKLIFDMTKGRIDPLGDENVLGFLPGLFTGTMAPFSGRFMVVGKSPLTGTWGDSNCGGHFGPQIKKCGYDGIFFIGKSEEPALFSSVDGETRLEPAGHLWGKDAIATEKALKKEKGNSAQIACIGGSGERRSLISGIFNDEGRMAARSGLGSVMGSKRLKGLVLKGNISVDYADKELVMKKVKNYNQRFRGKPDVARRTALKIAPKLSGIVRALKIPMKADQDSLIATYKLYGTSFANTISAEIGDTPVKNWKGVGSEDFPLNKSKKISGLHFEKLKVSEYGCSNCPVQCGAIVESRSKNVGQVHRPEYETCGALGTLLLNDDLDSIIEMTDMCNRAGIDTISAGMTIAFAMECFEEGILTIDDTGGLALKWGDASTIISLLEMMIERKGVGDLLADGVKKASERIGKGSEKFAVHAGGQELPMHDSRLFPSLAFTYAYDPTPGRHTAPSIDFSELGPIHKYLEGMEMSEKEGLAGKAENQALVSSLHHAYSSLGLCLFSSMMGPYPMLEVVRGLTGWDLSADDLLEAGMRIQMMRFIFNAREGVAPDDVYIHPRALGNPPLSGGPTKGVSVDLEEMKNAFFEKLCIDPSTGLPEAEQVKKLGLEDEVRLTKGS